MKIIGPIAVIVTLELFLCGVLILRGFNVIYTEDERPIAALGRSK